MPRYDYRCEDGACHTDTFEVTRSFHDDSSVNCPACGAEAKKLLSQVAVHFKGSGFYVTDNRASNGASGTAADSSDAKTDTGAEANTGSGAAKDSKASKAAPAEKSGKSKASTPASSSS